jgi:hypothetical protein
MQKTYDIYRHIHTNEIRLLSKSEQRLNRNFEPISYKDLKIRQLSELLKETFPQRYKTYVDMCVEKYGIPAAKEKIYQSAVIGELQP